MEEDPGNNDFDDSACSTPFVSAPSSPGRGFFYSAPASPIHFMLSNSSSYLDSSGSSSSTTTPTPVEGFEFEGSVPAGSMSSADELFLNGQIRPMKLSSHLERPQVLAPLLENELSDDDENNPGRGRDSKLSSRSRRRARSMSPMRTNDAFQWLEDSTEEIKEEAAKDEAKTEEDGASSVGRTSKRWVFLKEFLYRSKSEGRSTNGNHKFWSSSKKSSDVKNKATTEAVKPGARKAVVNGAGKRRVARSPHELHYTTNRAQAEELRRKTYLPYKQGLLGCLGFSSKSYGAMNGFARALNPVSSR
ncbi:hypothetical protein Hdeb2414_s0014g00425711 [Helianthus debilis subsp. tardiflorus]